MAGTNQTSLADMSISKLDRPLKVVLIHAADSGGGAERSTLFLHLTLLKMGHDSRLYVGYKNTDAPGVHEIERRRAFPGIMRMCQWLENNLGWQHLYSPGFRKLKKVIDPDTDILHIHSIWGSGGFADVGALPALSRRFPTIITLREQWLTTGHCSYSYDCDRFQNGCGRCPDLTIAPAISRDGTRFNFIRKRVAVRRSRVHITTVSNWMRQMALASPIMARKEISVIYNGVDDSIFSPGSQGEARKALGIPEGRFVVLIAGQSIEGIHRGEAQHAIKAINHYKDERILPLLVGRSAHLVAETLSVPSIVLPFQESPEAMAKCYQAADVTAVCSEVESFGRIAAESQACGTPVIAFATGGLPEVVKHGVGGLVVPKGDIGALMAAMKYLLENPSELKRMGVDGASWAHAQFSNLKIANDFISLYGNVIAQRLKKPW
jgi:glycosyltransferase involved in cell wall biosynthesis